MRRPTDASSIKEREGGEILIMNVLNYWSLIVFKKIVLKVTIF